jgi:acetyl-CoA C-acetyltransferase
MSSCIENITKKLNITRAQQDEYVISSYKRSAEAWKNKIFDAEITPVRLPGKPEVVINEDEQYKHVNFDGSTCELTADKASDGASALVLMTAQAAEKHKCKPLARVLGFADAETDPIVIKKLLKQTGLKKEDVKLWEINEASSLVVLGIFFYFKILELFLRYF